MVRGELGVDLGVGLAEFQRGVAAVVLGLLLLDDVGLDGGGQVVGLARQVGRHVVVGARLLERRVAQVGPEHRDHPELVGLLEGLRDLLDLPAALGGPVVDGGADGHGAHVEGLLDRREQGLVVDRRVGEQLVVVDLEDERDLVRVLARDRVQHPHGRGHGVAPALDREPHDVFRVEVDRGRCEGGARGVLDPLVDRQDGEVARARETALGEESLQAPHDPGAAVLRGDHAVDVVRSGQVQGLARYRPAGVGEERLGLGAEQSNDVGHGKPPVRVKWRRATALKRVGAEAARGRRRGLESSPWADPLHPGARGTRPAIPRSGRATPAPGRALAATLAATFPAPAGRAFARAAGGRP